MARRLEFLTLANAGLAAVSAARVAVLALHWGPSHAPAALLGALLPLSAATAARCAAGSPFGPRKRRLDFWKCSRHFKTCFEAPRSVLDTSRHSWTL